MKKTILALVLGLTLFACNETTEKKSAFDAEAAKKELQTYNDAFAATITSKDSVAFGNLYAADAVRMYPNHAELVGRAEIVADFNFAVNNGIGSGKLTCKEVMGDENLLVSIGVYELFANDGSAIDKGKYVGLLKKIDGKLVSIRDIWNSDLPAVPMTK